MTATEPSADKEDVNLLKERVEAAAEDARAARDATESIASALGDVAKAVKRDRWAVAGNSWVAYILFVALLGGAFYAVHQARVSAWQERMTAQDAALADAQVRAARAEEQLGTQQAAARAAREYYEFIERGDHAEVLARSKAVLALELSPTERALFASAQSGALAGVVDQLLEEGRAALAKNRSQEAAETFRAGLEKDPDGPRSAELHLALGRALAAMQKWPEARVEMTAALSKGVAKKVIEARYYYAEVLREAGDTRGARAEYARFARAHSRHPLSWKSKYWVKALGR